MCVLLLQVDDHLAELFLAEEPIEPDVLKAAIRRATLANKFAPVFMGSAYKNKGKLCAASTVNQALRQGHMLSGSPVSIRDASSLGVADLAACIPSTVQPITCPGIKGDQQQSW